MGKRSKWWSKSWAPVLTLVLAGCGGYLDDAEGDVAINEIPLGRQGIIPVQKGYLDSAPVEFYRFGSFVPKDASWFPPSDEFPGMAVTEMYILSDEGGTLNMSSEQAPIIDVLPWQAHYSDFFELVRFVPDGDYSPNDIKSRATLLRAGYKVVHTGVVVNCPVVGPGAALAQPTGKVGATFKKLKVWYRKKVTHCILAEVGRPATEINGKLSDPLLDAATKFLISKQKINSTVQLYGVPAAEINVLHTTAFAGADKVSNIGVPGNDIFRYAPTNKKEFSPLVKVWQKRVPSDYKLGSLDSYTDLVPIKDFKDPDRAEKDPATYQNCSIVTIGAKKGAQ